MPSLASKADLPSRLYYGSPIMLSKSQCHKPLKYVCSVLYIHFQLFIYLQNRIFCLASRDSINKLEPRHLLRIPANFTILFSDLHIRNIFPFLIVPFLEIKQMLKSMPIEPNDWF